MEIIPIKLKMTKAVLLKGETSLLVDTGNPGDHKLILYEMEANGIPPEKLDYILITHAHVDHYGSVNEIRERTGAKVIIHEKDYDAMKEGENSEIVPFSLMGRLMAPFIRKGSRPSNLKGAKADVLIKDDEAYDLHPLGLEGRIVHTPGHTPGSCSVFLDEKTAIVGDLMMSFIIPEKPGRPLFAYNKKVWQNSIRKVLDAHPERIIITHGNEYIYDDFKSFCNRELSK